MEQQDEGRIFSPFPPSGFTMPFFYDSLSLFWVFYQVEAKLLEPYLSDTGLKPAIFAGQGLVSIDFQNYSAHLTNLISAVNEVEFNIHVYPVSRARETPAISLHDYLIGQEQSKNIGGFRLHVPADNKIAVEAGIDVFGERKFLTTFKYSVPNNNDAAQKTWCYQVNDPNFAEPSGDDPFIYKLQADLSDLVPVMGNASALPLYSLLPGGPDKPPGEGRLIQSRWDIFGLYQTYLDLPHDTCARITLEIGTSQTEMCKDIRAIIGANQPVAARVFKSPPSAAENRAFYVNPE